MSDQLVFEGIEVGEHRIAVQGFKDIDARFHGKVLTLKPGDEIEVTFKARVKEASFAEKYDGKADTFVGSMTRRMLAAVKLRSVRILSYRSREDIEAEWQKDQIKKEDARQGAA